MGGYLNRFLGMNKEEQIAWRMEQDRIQKARKELGLHISYFDSGFDYESCTQEEKEAYTNDFILLLEADILICQNINLSDDYKQQVKSAQQRMNDRYNITE